MIKKNFSRMFALAIVAAALFGAGVLAGANKYGKPKSVIHVVTLYWADGATDAQKKAALDGVETMAADIPGIRNVWLRSIKVQGDAGGKRLTHAFAMEFESEAALKAYADHPAHKKWEGIYTPARGESRSHDITN